MPENTINTILKLKRGTDASWLESTEVLKEGEPGFNKTTNVLKIGNGIDTWQNLNSINGGNCNLKIFSTTPTADYLLENNEIGYDKINNILKIGDGTTVWENLPLIGDKPESFEQFSLDNHNALFSGYYNIKGSKYCHILGKIVVNNNYGSLP